MHALDMSANEVQTLKEVVSILMLLFLHYCQINKLIISSLCKILLVVKTGAQPTNVLGTTPDSLYQLWKVVVMTQILSYYHPQETPGLIAQLPDPTLDQPWVSWYLGSDKWILFLSLYISNK